MPNNPQSSSIKIYFMLRRLAINALIISKPSLIIAHSINNTAIQESKTYDTLCIFKHYGLSLCLNPHSAHPFAIPQHLLSPGTRKNVTPHSPHRHPVLDTGCRVIEKNWFPWSNHGTTTELPRNDAGINKTPKQIKLRHPVLPLVTPYLIRGLPNVADTQ